VSTRAIALLCWLLALAACSRTDPTAPRWKVHIEPDPAAPVGLGLRIAPPESGYDYSANEFGDEVIIVLSKYGDIAFSATITRTEAHNTYQVSLSKSRGHAASITAAPGLTLRPQDEGGDTNILTLDPHQTAARFVIMPLQP
jgi:hypothetical protein